MDQPTRILTAEPLTAEAFAPFGDVIEAAGASFPINDGMCDRFHDRARLDFTGEGARPGISVAHGRPYALPHELHPGRAPPARQPGLRADVRRPFLVIVAPDEDGRPGAPRAYLAGPGPGRELPAQHLARGADPAGRPASFLIVDRIGPGNNLEEFRYPAPWTVTAA